MKIIAIFVTGAVIAHAQVPIAPLSPKAFENRGAGGSTGVAPSVDPASGKKPKTVRYISQVALSEPRAWTSTDGKKIEAALIAFEDLVAESTDGSIPPQPAVPKHPTVVRDGSIRLVVNRKISVLPLSRLSPADQEFVEKVRLQHASKP